MFGIGKKQWLCAATAAGAALMSALPAQALIWTSNSGTSIDFLNDGTGSYTVNGSNHLVLTPSSAAQMSVRALGGTNATNTALFNTVNTAAVTGNPNLRPYITFTYVERAYDLGSDAWRGQDFFINGTGGGTSNNRFQLGSQFGTTAATAGRSADFFIRKNSVVDGRGYLNTSLQANMDGFAGAGTPQPRSDNVTHTMTRGILDGNGTVEIVMDGKVFSDVYFPGASFMEHNEGEVYGLDQFEIRVRSGPYSGAANNDYIITDLFIGTGYNTMVPEPASLGLLAVGGAMLLRRRKA